MQHTGCQMVISTNFDPRPDVYLSGLTLSGNVVTATLSRVSDGELLAVASAAQVDEYRIPVNFTGVSGHDDIRGTIVFGDLAEVGKSIPDGIYSYASSETVFEARCVRPKVPCVSGIYIGDSTTAPRLRGDIALIAGDNIRLEYDEDNKAIVINADSDYRYNDVCNCGMDDARDSIKTINGVSLKNVEIVGDNACVDVKVEGNRVVISDKCSKPCCGCAELTFLNQKTNEIATALSRLQSFSSELSGKVSGLISNEFTAQQGRITYI